MSLSPAVSLEEYKRAVRGLKGVAVVLLASVPLSSLAFSADVGTYLFPPLDIRWRVASVILVPVMMLSPYLTGQYKGQVSIRDRAKIFRWYLVAVVGGMIAFIIASQRLVIAIEVPERGVERTVVVGFVRIPEAAEQLGGIDDREALRQQGLTDDAIYQIWTGESILIARLVLFIAHSCALLGLARLCGVAIVWAALDARVAPAAGGQSRIQ